MTFDSSHRRLRNVVVTVLLAAGLTVPIAVAQPAIANAPEPSVSPSGSYPSIDSCALSLTPMSIGSTDTFTVTATFTPENAQYRLGADGLGARRSSVLVGASSPYVLTGPASTIESTIGLASGRHSMDLYAVDADGDAVGPALCTASYEYSGPVDAPIGQPLVELPHATTGVPYQSGVVTGTADPSNWWVYTPTGAEGTRVVTSCDVSYVSNTPVSGPLYEDQGNGGRGGLFSPTVTNYKAIGDSPGFQLMFAPADPSLGCGSLMGMFREPGTYTLLQTVHWTCPSVVAPGSVPSAVPSDVASQTYSSQRTLILVVDMAPSFTG